MSALPFLRTALTLLALAAAPALAENPLQPSPAWEDMRSAVIGTEA